MMSEPLSLRRSALGCLDRSFQTPFPKTPYNGPEHKREPSLEGLAVAYDNHVDVGQTIGTALKV